MIFSDFIQVDAAWVFETGIDYSRCAMLKLGEKDSSEPLGQHCNVHSNCDRGHRTCAARKIGHKENAIGQGPMSHYSRLPREFAEMNNDTSQQASRPM